MSKIDWSKIGASAGKNAGELVDAIKAAHDKGGEDPARDVELALKEKIAAIKKRFEAAKGGTS